MTLYEQLEKLENDLRKLDEKKREFQEKKKKLLSEIELHEAKKAAEKSKEIIQIVQESFGEVTEENLELFRRVMKGQAEELQRKKVHLEQGQDLP